MNTGLTPSQIEGMRSTEDIIQAKGLTAPRVTPADIDDAIAEVHYLNAANAVAIVRLTYKPDEPHGISINTPLSLLTICLLVLKNGFTVVGKSACASPENFDVELGKKIALEDAKRQLWPLLGYSLRQKLYERDVLRVGQPG